MFIKDIRDLYAHTFAGRKVFSLPPEYTDLQEI